MSVCLNWLLRVSLNENVSTVILGASKMEQLEENLESAEVLKLLDENIQKELLMI